MLLHGRYGGGASGSLVEGFEPHRDLRALRAGSQLRVADEVVDGEVVVDRVVGHPSHAQEGDEIPRHRGIEDRIGSGPSSSTCSMSQGRLNASGTSGAWPTVSASASGPGGVVHRRGPERRAGCGAAAVAPRHRLGSAGRRRRRTGPPGRTSGDTGKTHLATALGIRACQAGHRVAFATAAEWVARLGEAHAAGRLHPELTRLSRTPLLVIDEVGYIPFEAEAANLFFQLVSSRYERASVIVTSNKPFGRWGEVFGDATVAAAMIDRLVHHADVVSLKGDSYRLKDRDLGRVPADDAT